MTINRKIVAGYAAMLAIFAIVVSIAFYALNLVQKRYGEFITVKEELVDGANELRTGTALQIQRYRGLLLFPERQQEFLDSLHQDVRNVTATLGKMKGYLADAGDAEGRAAADLEEIARLQADLELAVSKGIALVQRAQTAEAVALSEAEVLPIGRKLSSRAEDFRNAQLKQAVTQRTDLKRTVDRLVIASALAALLGLAIGLAFSLYLSRTITRQLRETISQLSTSSAEILATTTQVASGAAETATAVSETTATVEEVKQTVQLANQKAKQVSESAQQAAQVSQSGRQAVEELIAGMERIREQTAATATSIVKLSEQVQAIGEIIATVNDLAEQSNLLAVNAAIEAAKAGEHGKGFAVVAQEIKSLAEQSKQATAQVRGILGDIQKATGVAVMATDLNGKAVDAGVQQSGGASTAIEVLEESITEAAQAALQIAASSQQQMVGMDQVALAMENIKQASMQNMTGTKQAEVAAQGLHELGSKLKSMIGQR